MGSRLGNIWICLAILLSSTLCSGRTPPPERAPVLSSRSPFIPHLAKPKPLQFWPYFTATS